MADVKPEEQENTDVAVKSEEPNDSQGGSLTQAVPTGKQLSKKAKVASVCEAVDRENWVEPQ